MIPIQQGIPINDAIISPMNIVTQTTMDEHGIMATKYRLTHDHTFESSDVQSLNNKTFLELHEPVKFGFSMF